MKVKRSVTGYRFDEYQGSGETEILKVCKHEMLELHNTDIPMTLVKQEVIGNEEGVWEFLEMLYKQGFDRVIWLCKSKQQVINNYHYPDEPFDISNITKYKITQAVLLSDLENEGCLYAYKEIKEVPIFAVSHLEDDIEAPLADYNSKKQAVEYCSKHLDVIPTDSSFLITDGSNTSVSRSSEDYCSHHSLAVPFINPHLVKKKATINPYSKKWKRKEFYYKNENYIHQDEVYHIFDSDVVRYKDKSITLFGLYEFIASVPTLKQARQVLRELIISFIEDNDESNNYAVTIVKAISTNVAVRIINHNRPIWSVEL